MKRAALMSYDGTYRYRLGRQWKQGRMMAWVMLNPSTADGQVDDPTITRCINFADAWGFGGFMVYNLFAYRSTSPRNLWLVNDPVGVENSRWVREAANYPLVVAAWGTSTAVQLLHRRQVPHHAEMSSALNTLNLHCLGTTKNGSPRHPLYLRKDTTPVPWREAA